MKPKTLCLAGLLVLAFAGSVRTDDLPGRMPDSDDPFGDCCVASIRMQTFNSWVVTCGNCAKNPGTYIITQPDPAVATYLDAKGNPADTRYDAAAATCQCPSLDARRAWELKMRTFGGQ
ncbi:MAG: hypothetical protein ACOY4F_04060 [Thermodesulfobacteriota bacterium]